MCEPWQDLNRPEYIRQMTNKFAELWGGKPEDYKHIAESSLDDFIAMDEVAYGAPQYDWCVDAAIEHAVEYANYA